MESDHELQDLVLSVHHAVNHTMNHTGTVKLVENHLGNGFFRKVQTASIQVPVPGNPSTPPGNSPPKPSRKPHLDMGKRSVPLELPGLKDAQRVDEGTEIAPKPRNEAEEEALAADSPRWVSDLVVVATGTDSWLTLTFGSGERDRRRRPTAAKSPWYR